MLCLQANLRQLRSSGGGLKTGLRIRAITRRSGAWTVGSDKGESCSAPIIVNAAGAWADQIATLAGVRPIGLQPKRRTIITFDAPPGTDWTGCPSPRRSATSSISRRRAGGCSLRRWTRCRASRAMPSRTKRKSRLRPTGWRSAQPSRSTGSTAAGRVSGLSRRTVIRSSGFAADAEGFFWLAGQGGFGLQTSPAMAAIADIADCRDALAGRGRCRGHAKPRPLSPAAGIGRPSARRPARTGGSSRLRPTC